MRLPKKFRLEGTEVRVSKIGDKVILEPLQPPPFDVAVWRDKLDGYIDIPFPDLLDDLPVEPDDLIRFD